MRSPASDESAPRRPRPRIGGYRSERPLSAEEIDAELAIGFGDSHPEHAAVAKTLLETTDELLLCSEPQWRASSLPPAESSTATAT